MGSFKLMRMVYAKARGSATPEFQGARDLFKAQIWPFYISAPSSSEAKVAAPLYGTIWCKSTTWWHPFLTHSLLAAILTLCFLECTKISHVFCLCTSARLPKMHPTFSERIHTHSSSFSSRTPPATTCPCETHAWLPWAVLGAHLCHWKTRVNTGDRSAKGRKRGFECGLHHLVAATVD